MSNLRSSSSVRVVAFVLAATYARTAAADSNPFRAWADFVTTPERIYRGPTIPFPHVPRPPDGALRVCSELLPLCVHGPTSSGAERVLGALAALEEAFEWLTADGWPVPHLDGRRGGTGDFDLYLIEGAPRPAASGADEPLATVPLDAASTFALLEASLPDDALRRCALDALVQAAIHGHDPGETEGVRRAVAAFATFRARGEYGCEDELQEAQRAPHLGIAGDDPRQVASAALLFAMLSRRHDRDTGRFVRGAFDLARQRSKSPAALHAAPDVWQAVAAMLVRAGESLDQAAQEFAVARYFETRAPGVLPALPVGARAAARWGPPLAKLPKHVAAHEPAIAAYGSAYLRLDTTGSPAGAQLKIWLRGEPGVRWALTAVRIDENGRELGRVSAPTRRVPESFLPVELDPPTKELLIVVTKLPLAPDGPPAADDEDAHYFKLILDR